MLLKSWALVCRSWPKATPAVLGKALPPPSPLARNRQPPGAKAMSAIVWMMPGRRDRRISRRVTFCSGPSRTNRSADATAGDATVHSVTTLSITEATPSSKSAGAESGRSAVTT